MIPMARRTRAVMTTVLVAGSVAGVAACGGGSSSPPAAQASTQPSGAADGGGFGARFQEIRQCLTAAGIAVPSFSPRPFPSRSRRAFPSGRPTAFPSGRPTAFPSGRFRGGGGGALGSLLRDPKARQALAACGITLPFGGAAPTATPAP